MILCPVIVTLAGFACETFEIVSSISVAVTVAVAVSKSSPLPPLVEPANVGCASTPSPILTWIGASIVLLGSVIVNPGADV